MDSMVTGQNILVFQILCKFYKYSYLLLLINFYLYRQQDMGLEKYETKDLFLHLVNPTLVVIITVVQLQIFHKKYLEMLNFPLVSRR